MRLKRLLHKLTDLKMPLLIVAGLGAVAGYLFSSGSSSTISNLEGVVVGAVLGVGAAAVYFSVKKI